MEIARILRFQVVGIRMHCHRTPHVLDHDEAGHQSHYVGVAGAEEEGLESSQIGCEDVVVIFEGDAFTVRTDDTATNI